MRLKDLGNLEILKKMCIRDRVIDSFENFSKLNLSQISQEDMETGLNIMRQLSEKDFSKDDIADVIKKAANFDMDKATAEIVDAKNAEIRELKKYKTLWESRNVTSDNNIIPMPTKE